MDCGAEVFEAEGARIGSPMTPGEMRACYDIMPAWSSQQLATATKETEMGRTASGSHNHLNLFDSGGSHPKNFPSWRDCALEWKNRMNDIGYKGGVYAPREATIEKVVSVYQGGPGCWESKGQTCANGETWVYCQSGSIELSIQQFCARVSTFMGLPTEVPWSPIPGGAGCQQVPGGATPTIYTLPEDAGVFDITPTCAVWVTGNRFEHRNGRPVQRIVLHTQEGSSSGSLNWWCSQGSQASSTIMVQKNGSILQIIPEEHGPWTNGDSCSPTSKGIAFINECQQNPNCCSLTMEIEGYFGDDHPKAQVDAIAWQCRQWMSKYHLDCADIIAHRDINMCSRANCCGSDLYNKTMQALGCPQRW